MLSDDVITLISVKWLALGRSANASPISCACYGSDRQYLKHHAADWRDTGKPGAAAYLGFHRVDLGVPVPHGTICWGLWVP